MGELAKSIGLIGFMAAGKTSVGMKLAEALGRAFFDTDSIIESISGKTISESFSQSGEDYFRRLESEVVREVCSRESAVISFGGGAPLDPSSAVLIRENSIVVLLCASIDTLVSRIQQNETRPLLAESGFSLRERIIALYSARKHTYKELADLVVSTEKRSAHQTAMEIIRRLGL